MTYTLLVVEPHHLEIIKQILVITKICFELENISFNNQTNYVLLENSTVVAYCTIASTKLFFDPTKKIKDIILPADKLTNINFVSVIGEVIYNLVRRPGNKFKGTGIILLNKILEKTGILMLSAEHESLREYYKNHGYIYTNMYDVSVDNIGQKVMYKKLS